MGFVFHELNQFILYIIGQTLSLSFVSLLSVCLEMKPCNNASMVCLEMKLAMILETCP